MDEPIDNNAFVFGNAIDSQYIIELYAGDYVMIEETFTDVLLEYDSFVQKIDACYLMGDIPGLKSAVHKIKPLFGFVGLTTIQNQCLQFENSCLSKSPEKLISDYTYLKDTLLKAHSIIFTEKERLSAFNAGQ